ncbi:ubiquinol-cytochrome C chaperone family protein [Pelagibius sp.]|uniref:ubiquinol-cytochrome C chaperone family protein n=1 Tax=Pelagibius sp. TaxID=1931238 RepID=UPI002609118D|nr:ubiquinol-cytochrome C chaperone family protein [Pelagibius sp.]
MVFKRLFRPKQQEEAAWLLYENVVQQARRTELFRDLGIPDSVDGRFESIVLHLVLVLRRMRVDFPEGEDIAAALQEVFIADMDRSLREMGAGDLGVGRRVQQMAEGFMGRLASYETALDEIAGGGGENGLRAALLRNVYGTLPEEAVDPAGLLGYVRAQMQALEAQEGTGLRAGKPQFAPF